MPSSFGSRLGQAFKNHSQLCVGIDPHASLLADWGLDDSVEGLRVFSNTVLDAAIGRVGIIKPQVSFFERFGSAGFKVLEDVCQRAADAGLVNIMDIKRGDIGSTMDAYFDAWLGKAAPFLCDAVTVSPYLGFESLNDFMSNALERGKGVICLVATSNPEGAQLQQARVSTSDESAQGTSIAADVMQSLNKVNQLTGVPGQLGSFGAVIGATLKLRAFGLDGLLTEQPTVGTPILAPGFGAQGARLADVERLFGASAKNVIASVSRSILQAGALGLEEAIDSAKAELVEAFA